MSSTRATAYVLAALLLSWSCGGGGGGYGGTTPTTPTTPTPPTGTANVVTITITGVKGATSFSPNPATCALGQTVVFMNADVVPHRVVLDDGSVDTGPIAPGASSTPQALGAVSKPYHCSIHPSMVGSLNSAATPDPPPCTGYCG
jgi:plastocyanin